MLAVGARVGTLSDVLLAHDRALGCADGKQEAIGESVGAPAGHTPVISRRARFARK